MNDLRVIQTEDVALFAQWEKEERPYPWSYDHFAKLLTHSVERGLVWAGEKAILGFGVVQLVDVEAHLLNIMVNPLLRRQGLGYKLLERIEDWCRRQNSTSVTLDVDEKNSPAVHLYQKRGFVVLQRRPHSYPRGEDALLMKKKL